MKSRIRVSPDGRRALLLGSEGSIFSIDLSTRRAETPRQLASSIRDACFYDNDTCYFVSGRKWWLTMTMMNNEVEDSHIVEYNLKSNTVIANYWDKDLFGAHCLHINGNYLAIGYVSVFVSISTFFTLSSSHDVVILQVFYRSTIHPPLWTQVNRKEFIISFTH